MSNKTPQIRFAGFAGDWEEKTLGDEVIFYSGLTYSPSNVMKNTGTLVLRSSNVKDGEIIDLGFTDNVYVSSDVVNSDNVQVGDVIVVVRNGSRSLIGKHAQIKQMMRNTVIGAFMTGVRYRQASFLNVLLSTPRFTIEIERNMGATINQITTGVFEKMQFFFPDKAEQTRIGNFFRNLDSLITQHQQELEKLKIMKKAMLEKMFPKAGAAAPEIRFAGFTGDWERRKITEIAKIFIGLVTKMTTHYRTDGTLLIRNSDIKDNFFAFAEEPIYLDDNFAEDNASRRLKIGDVVTVHTGDVGTSAVITKKEEGSIGFATINTRPNRNIIGSIFLSVFLNTDKHKRFAVKMSTGDGRTNYNLKDFFELEISFPTLAEQTRIGAFFKNLGGIIVLREQELETLQNIKKAMLGKMFV